jgi:eukaryotic-like serine/threonine-protein kinase
MMFSARSLAIEAYFLRARVLVAVAEKSRDGERAALMKRIRRDYRRVGKDEASLGKAGFHLGKASLSMLAGQSEAAIPELEKAIEIFEREGIKLLSAAAKRRLGPLLGGDSGAQALDEGTSFMGEQGLVDPERVTAMLLPGFGES